MLKTIDNDPFHKAAGVSPRFESRDSSPLEKIAPGIWKIVLGAPEAITPVSVRCSKPAWDGLPGYFDETQGCPFAPEEIHFRTGKRGCVVTLPFTPEEGIFGLGLQLKSHLQSGKKKQLRVNADPIADMGDSHAPVPLYASTRGYAVYIDTARYVSLYLGTHVSLEKLRERAREKHGQPILNADELYRQQAIGREVVLDIPAARGVTLYIFGGPDLQTAIARYNLFSGGGCLPPLYGLGNWYRACTRHGQNDVLDLVRGFQQDKLPFQVMGLEPGWQTHFYPNSFVWSDRFPEPEKLVSDLAKEGLRLNLWENAFVHPDAPFAPAIRPFCANQPSTDGLAPDFLDPEAKRLFAGHHRDLLVNKGVSGFKLDECDNGDFVSAWSFPEHAEFPSGADGELMHCLYGVHYQHTLNDVFEQSGKRHFGLVRSSGALAAPLPYVLYSDLYEHRDFLRGMVNAGFSGLLWTPEVRHAASVEDLIRRLQSAALSPMNLINGWYIPLPPWKQVDRKLNETGHEMAGSGRATDLVREILRFRLKLLPYLYSAFAHYRFKGVPPFRALAMDFPNDKKTWICDRQWMIGNDLLAAPLVAGEDSLDVYLPEGVLWREFATGRVCRGGGYDRVEAADLSHIPLYVRDGAILPLAEAPGQLLPDTVLTLNPHIYAAGNAECTIYEDDGETFDFEKGRFAWLNLKWEAQRGCELINATPESPYRPRRYRLGAPVFFN